MLRQAVTPAARSCRGKSGPTICPDRPSIVVIRGCRTLTGPAGFPSGKWTRFPLHDRVIAWLRGMLYTQPGMNRQSPRVSRFVWASLAFSLAAQNNPAALREAQLRLWLDLKEALMAG